MSGETLAGVLTFFGGIAAAAIPYFFLKYKNTAEADSVVVDAAHNVVRLVNEQMAAVVAQNQSLVTQVEDLAAQNRELRSVVERLNDEVASLQEGTSNGHRSDESGGLHRH